MTRMVITKDRLFSWCEGSKRGYFSPNLKRALKEGDSGREVNPSDDWFTQIPVILMENT